MYSNKNSYKNSKKIEMIKWYLVFIMLCIPIVLKYIYKEWIFILHILLFIFFFISSILIAFSTIKGKEWLNFMYQSKNEIKKIIWPSYKETFHTTFIVLIVIIFISLILWGLDNILFRLVSFITHLRL